jgi:hypothetical protein
MRQSARGYGLRINEDKTKYIIMKQGTTIDEPYSKFKTETKMIKAERVKHFEYQGVTVNSDKEEELEVIKE